MPLNMVYASQVGCGHTSENNVEDVLYGVGSEISTATCKTSTLEYVDNVVPIE